MHQFLLINKRTLKTETFEDAGKLATRLWGCNKHDYVVLKHERYVVQIQVTDVALIAQALREA
jgi:hypothetical protein